MKKRYLQKKQPAIITGLTLVSLSLTAQQLPQRGYINWGTEGVEFADMLPTWQKGQKISEDDNFFISRVKPKLRFRNVATQVNQNFNETNDKKLTFWVPINNTPNNALPDGVFDSEVFPMWSYITHYGNWTAPFVRVPGNFSDVAHKNGVGVSVVAGIPFGGLTDGWKRSLEVMIQQGSDKMADMLEYYGIDGLGYNSEFSTSSSTLIPNLNKYHQELYAKLQKTGKMPLLQNTWYDGTNDNGGITFDQGLGSHNDGVFGNGENPATALFLNYNWNKDWLLSQSVNKAKEMGRDPLDLFAGMNMQGAEPKYGTRWPLLAQYPISIGLWGAHSQNMLWESRGEKGALPAVQQRTYMLRAERYFTGGTRNPVNTPELSNSMQYNADNYDFFGMSKMMSAKSSLSWDLATEPFITYFNLGNGKFFNRAGKTESNREWYNIGIQDYLPTWRWWFADSFMGRTPENVPAKGLDAEFTWNDAWFGGSLMRIFGSHSDEYLHLFKTQFKLRGGDEITVRYKVMGGSTDLTLALSAEGSENTLLAESGLKVVESGSIQIGKWVEKKFIIRGALTSLNNKTLAMIALHFTNAQNLDLYLGEFSIVRGTFETPAAPVIEKTAVLAANHKGLDGKIIFNMPNDKLATEVCYNLDVKTAMFNLYAQQEGKEPVLMGATTSWAGMFYAIPFDYTVENGRVRLGVSAVSLDMKNESEITWGEYTSPGAYSINDDIAINKTTIKPNEDFEIKFIDAKHEPSKWEILDSKGTVMATSENAISISVENGISEIGAYTLRVTGNVQQADGTRKEVERTFGSFIQITSTAVGALPKILSLTGNDKESDLEVGISAPIALKYTGRPANGVGSQGVDMNEKGFGFRASDMGMQPNKSFTLAFWVKVNKYNGGTQLVNIRDKQEGWPKTDWGWFWNFADENGKITTSTIRGTDASDNNGFVWEYENAKIEAGPWTHLAYVFEYNSAGKFKFQLYINGEKQPIWRWRRGKDNGYTMGEPTEYQGTLYGMRGANMVAFGGNNFSNNGIDGTLDNFQYWDKALTAEEVKATMESFETIPENLVGYWDFETGTNNESGFVSTGTNKTATAGLHEYIAATGEGMGNIKYVAPSFKPGCPFVEGSNYKVVTKPSWSADKGSISDVTGSDLAGSAKVSFAEAGTYNTTLTLENGWGTDSKTINYIKVDTADGIEEVSLESELSAYPNPFINEVNICFAQDGEYTVRVYNLSGSLVAEKTQTIASGEFVTVSVNGEAGSYIAQVYQGNKLVRAMKLIKH